MELGERKDDLRRRLLDARAGLKASVAGLGPAELTTPFLGEWSTREIIGHLCAWDREVVNGVREALSGCPANFFEWDWDEFNAREVSSRASRPFEQICGELDSSFGEMLACLDAIPEHALFEHSSPWEDWLIDPAEFFRLAARHEQEHTAHILDYRRRLQPEQHSIIRLPHLPGLKRPSH